MTMIDDYNIRTTIKKEDNKRLLELEKKCPMKGYVTMYYDHSPDFFKFYKIFGDVKPYFLEQEGKLALQQAQLGANKEKSAALSGPPAPPSFE